MKIGIPKENKVLEGRVTLTPPDCQKLLQAGHQVFIETRAGVLSGYLDQEYLDAGVIVCESAADLYQSSQLIVKVKEPVEEDLRYLKSDHLLFCYLHLAANRQLTERLCEIGLTAIAFETVTDEQGFLPLLKPMSQIAGKLAVQIGTHLLHQPQGGKGLMLGGLSLTEHGHVVVLGAGVAGSAAASLAAAGGAQVSLIDRDPLRYQQLVSQNSHIQGILSSEETISHAVRSADLLIGAVLLPGLHTPRLVSESLVSEMQAGSVIIDISVDQGGCIETIHPTDYQQPTYIRHDVLHFGVTNMPGAVPRTASQALSASLLPYVMHLCQEGWQNHRGLQEGINVRDGRIDNPLIAQAMV